MIEKTLERDGAWEGRLLHSCYDGRIITVDSRWALDTSRGERVVLEISRDITARLQAEEDARARERQLRFVTDSAPVLIAHCDRSHRFMFVNKPYAARFGLQPSDLIGRSIAEVLGAEAYRTIHPYLTEALAGRRVEVEVAVPYETLGTQHMRFAYEPELDEQGKVIGYVAAVINVSDRHKAEEALREANERKDVFLATLAHELRNPLAAMGNAVQLMMIPELDRRAQRQGGGDHPAAAEAAGPPGGRPPRRLANHPRAAAAAHRTRTELGRDRPHRRRIDGAGHRLRRADPAGPAAA